MEGTREPEWLVVKRERQRRILNCVRGFGAYLILLVAFVGLLEVAPGIGEISPFVWLVFFTIGSLLALGQWAVAARGSFSRALTGHLAVMMIIFAGLTAIMWSR